MASVLAKVTARPKPVLPRALALVWTWTPNRDNPSANVVFLIHSTTNLTLRAAQWPIVAVVSTNRWAFTLDRPTRFFFLTASNTVTHLDSLW